MESPIQLDYHTLHLKWILPICLIPLQGDAGVITEKYTLTDPMGLHARIATEIARVAHRYRSCIMVHFNGTDSDATDVIGLMALDIREGETLTMTIDGTDETEARTSLKEMLAPYC